MAGKKTTANTKKRNWAFVLYPESAPEDWVEQLQLTGLQCAISPLHDRDVDPTGTPKKPHYHVILAYSGPTSYNVVKRLTDSLNQPIPQPLEQIRGYYRYLTHKDNPDKAQYDEADISTINGFCITDYVPLTASEVDQIKSDLTDLIDEQGMTNYAQFVRYVKHNCDANAFNVASNNTIFFNTYLRAARFENIEDNIA